MHSKKGANRRVDPRQLHHDEAEQFLTSTRASIALQAEPADVELFERGEQLEGEGVVSPVLLNDRRNLRLHECADFSYGCQFVGVKGFGEVVKVTVWRRQGLGLFNFFECCGHFNSPYAFWLSFEGCMEGAAIGAPSVQDGGSLAGKLSSRMVSIVVSPRCCSTIFNNARGTPNRCVRQTLELTE